MKIPVFHDDQHGTAIIVGAAITNGLRVVGKELSAVKLVCSGAGAAALACLDLLVLLGIPRENIWVADIAGVVYQGRKEEMDDNKARYARKTDARKLADVIADADVFLAPAVLIAFLPAFAFALSVLMPSRPAAALLTGLLAAAGLLESANRHCAVHANACKCVKYPCPDRVAFR